MEQAVHEEFWGFEPKNTWILKRLLSYYTIHGYRGKINHYETLETFRPAYSQSAPLPMGYEPHCGTVFEPRCSPLRHLYSCSLWNALAPLFGFVLLLFCFSSLNVEELSRTWRIVNQLSIVFPPLVFLPLYWKFPLSDCPTSLSAKVCCRIFNFQDFYLL